MDVLFLLSEAQMRRIEPFFPLSRGIPRVDDDPFRLIGQGPTSPDATARMLTNAQAIAARLRSTSLTDTGSVIDALVDRIDVGTDATAVWLDRRALARELGFENTDTNPGSSHDPIRISVSAKLKRCGILPGGQSASRQLDRSLIKAIARAHIWWQKLDTTPALSVDDLARREGITPSYLTRILRLAFLDPATVERILAGTAPAHLNLGVLQAPEAIPMLWTAQRAKHRIAV